MTTQFLGMIANYVLWPRMLLLDWDPDAASVARAVEEAALTVHARHAVPPLTAGAGDETAQAEDRDAEQQQRAHGGFGAT